MSFVLFARDEATSSVLRFSNSVFWFLQQARSEVHAAERHAGGGSKKETKEKS